MTTQTPEQAARRKAVLKSLLRMRPDDRERLLELEAKRRGLPTKPPTKKD